jgi:hypothetical protein
VTGRNVHIRCFVYMYVHIFLCVCVRARVCVYVCVCMRICGGICPKIHLIFLIIESGKEVLSILDL